MACLRQGVWADRVYRVTGIPPIVERRLDNSRQTVLPCTMGEPFLGEVGESN